MNEAYAGATAEQLGHPMVQEFLHIHNYFRGQLKAMMDFVDELLTGEQSLDGPQTAVRIQMLIQAGARYTQVLHAHHHIETSMLFPELSNEGLEAPVIDRLNAEHDEIAVLIDGFSDGIQRLSSLDPSVMNSDLRRLADALHAHLAYEETHVCPLLARMSHWPGY